MAAPLTVCSNEQTSVIWLS